LVSHFHKFIDNLRNLAAKFTHDLMYRHCSEFSNCLVFGKMVVHNCHELHEHNVLSLLKQTHVVLFIPYALDNYYDMQQFVFDCGFSF